MRQSCLSFYRPHAAWRSVTYVLPLVSACLLAACGGGDDPVQPVASGFTLGGGVSGLASGRSVVLQNNGTDDLNVTANGAFTFVGRVQANAAYAVTVKTQPEGQSCAVAQGTGVASANVNSVAVACTNLPAARYSIGGTVSGLAAGGVLVLQSNGGDDLGISANGGFTFANPLAAGAAYAVTIKTQPAGQTCSLRNAGGTVASANVSAIEVVCATNSVSPSVGVLEGIWKMDSCVSIGANAWSRGTWHITRESDTRIALAQAALQYGNAQCVGASSFIFSPSSVGHKIIERSEANATVSAFWGPWVTSSVPNRTVYVLKGAHLCVLGDPFNRLPTLELAEAAANVSITGGSCYTRL